MTASIKNTAGVIDEKCRAGSKAILNVSLLGIRYELAEESPGIDIAQPRIRAT